MHEENPLSGPTPACTAVPAQQVEPQLLGPVSERERVEIIDIVRGLALFGILAANIRGFAGPPAIYFDPSRFWPGLADRVAQAFVDTFIQGKFVTIFACLFGVGFTVQHERAAARGVRLGRTWVRRLGILVVFGLVHGLLIWFGDILLPYALIGLMLFLLRRKSDTTLATWLVVGQFVPTVVMSLMLLHQGMSGRPLAGSPVPGSAELASIAHTFATGSWSEIQTARAHDVFSQNWSFFPFFFMPLLGLFCAGMLAWRHRLFQPPAERLPAYRRVMWWGFGIGIGGNATSTALRWALDIPSFPPNGWSVVVSLIQYVSVPSLSAAYVSAVILACQNPVWHRRLAPFGAVGRMALTNYLMQSVICTLIFYSYGLGLFGRVGPALLMILTFLIYATQPMVSLWWLARFRFGPAEWLWRSMTYGRLQPMRRSAQSA